MMWQPSSNMIPPGYSANQRASCGVDDLAHHGVNLERVAQPALLQEVAQHDDGGVVAIHVAHLHHELLMLLRR